MVEESGQQQEEKKDEGITQEEAAAQEEAKEEAPHEEGVFELVIPRGIATGIVFEAAEKFGLDIDQEVRDEDVPKIVLRGDSKEVIEKAHRFIYEKHKQWIESLEEQRRMRRERILRKLRKK